MSFPKYSKYKDSGVEWLGEVPAHWAVKRLRYVAELNPSKSEVRTLPAESSVSFIPMEAVGEDGSLSLEQARPIGEVLAGYTYVREGDVTIAKITPCFENGKGAVMRGLKNHVGFGTTELTVMRPIAGLTTSDYLYRVVSSEPFRVLGESSMYGAGGQKRVPDDFVRNFSIAWPPYKEQEQIQAFLDHETARIDALVEEQQRLVALLKEKRQAVISHAVTKGLDSDVAMKDSGVEWLGEVPAHWGTPRLKHIADAQGGGTPSKEREDYWAGDIPWVSPKDMKRDIITKTIDNVSEEAVVDSGLKIIPYRSVLVVVRGMILAHTFPVAISGAEVTINQDMKAIIPASERLSPEYLLLLLRGIDEVIFDCIDSSAHGTKKLQWDDFFNTQVPLPSLDEQLRISSEVQADLDQLERLTSQAQLMARTLSERRSALISAAVTGKIDVRGWRADQEADQTEILMAAEERATYG